MAAGAVSEAAPSATQPSSTAPNSQAADAEGPGGTAQVIQTEYSCTPPLPHPCMTTCCCLFLL